MNTPVLANLQKTRHDSAKTQPCIAST